MLSIGPKLRAMKRIGGKGASIIVRNSKHVLHQKEATRNFSSLCHLDISSGNPKNDFVYQYNNDKKLQLQSAAIVCSRNNTCARQSSTFSTLETPGTISSDKVDSKSSRLMTYKEAAEMTKVLQEPDFHKLGSFSEETWHRLVLLIKSWNEFRTSESVQNSFALLERLVLEQELLLQNRTSISSASRSKSVVQRFMSEKEQRESEGLSRELLSTDLLNRVIKTWRDCWKLRKSNITPEMVLDQLDGYMDRSPSLHPDTKTYNMLLDALTRRYDHEKSQEVAEDIMQRITNNSEDLSWIGKHFSFKNETPTKLGKLRCINDISPDPFTFNTLMNVYSRSGSPKQAEYILTQLNEEFLAGRSSVVPNARMFTTCISAWARSNSPDAPEKAESLLELMVLLYREKSIESLKPVVAAYNALIDCWVKSGRPDAGEQAERILRTLETSHELQPDKVSYKTTILALLQGTNDNTRAERVLQRMEYSYMRGNTAAKPDAGTFEMMLHHLNRLPDQPHWVAVKAESYLGHMKHLGIQPTLPVYNTVLEILVKSKRHTGGLAERILQEMNHPSNPVQPNTYSYNLFLQCLPKKWRTGGIATHAEHMLREMKQPHRLKGNNVDPDTRTYETVISLFVKQGQARQAERLFREMYSEYERGNKTVVPDLGIFNAVLSSWANTDAASDVERVEAIVRLLHEVPKSGEIGIKPDIRSCNILLHCLSKVDSAASRKHAETVLSQMEREWKAKGNVAMKPDKYSYTSVMKGHANVGDLFGTKEVLNRMMEEYQNGNDSAKPDIYAYNTVLVAIARGSKGRNENAGKMAEEVFGQIRHNYVAGVFDFLPNKFSYDLKISCWANSGHPQAAEKAELIMQEMEKMAEDGYPELRPDKVTYTSVINCYAKSGNPTQAEALLERMLDLYSNRNEDMKPTIETINTVLAAMARSGEHGAAKRAESYLRDLLTFRHASFMNLKPDIVTFTTVISAWANSGDPRAAEKAKSLLREVDILSQKPDYNIRIDSGFLRSVLRACAIAGDHMTVEALLKSIVDGDDFGHIKPDRYMYQTVLHALAKSRREDAPEKAEALLSQMKTLSASRGNKKLLPDTDCYHSVLECWSNSERKKLAVDRAEVLLLEMEQRAKDGDESAKPSPATYSGVINMMAKNGEIHRTKAILKRIYQQGNQVEAFVS